MGGSGSKGKPRAMAALRRWTLRHQVQASRDGGLEEVDISAIRYKPRMLKAPHLTGFSLKSPSSACFLPPSFPVYWSCQLIARPSNVSLKHWQQIGGVSIDENILIDRTIHRAIDSRSVVSKRYFADIGKSWLVLIVCGGILPLYLSVIWLLIIRYFVAVMTWITVVLFNALAMSVTMFCYIKAGWIGNDPLAVVIGESNPYVHISGREINHIRAATVLVTAIMVIAFLCSVAIVRRILTATPLLKVVAKVIGEVQALIIFPVVPHFILAIFHMLWFSATLQSLQLWSSSPK